ncbi:MAG TPA: HAD family acid phosphatase [Jatrophihabitantaceae bacterium]|jgi:predicted secreted acid phosphatase
MADQIETAPGHRRLRSRASVPLLAGSLIAAAGLVFGGLATASADHPSSAHGAGVHPAPTSTAPARHGDAIPNVTLVENQIKAYYGSVPTTVTLAAGPTAVTFPSPDANYAKEVEGIEAKQRSYFAHAIKQYQHHNHGTAKPALVFDIDDTTLNTYDYEIYSSFAYNPVTNGDFVDHAAFPAVFGMPDFVNWAGKQGYTVFFLTGRPEHQRPGTITNLTNVGYQVPLDTSHVYLKYESTQVPPSYLTCTGAVSPVTGKPTCSTIEYKSGTRAHIESLGYKILGDFGDQFSDLEGGHAGHQVKIPNPMYYLP